MMNLKSHFSRLVFISIAFFSFFGLASFRQSANAWEANFTNGIFEPDDGLVRQVFNSSPIYSLGLFIPYRNHLNWALSLSTQDFTSRTYGLENEIALTGLHLGFEKRFPESGSENQHIEPYFGAGVSYYQVTAVLEDDFTSGEFSESENAWGTYWEIGLVFPLPFLEPFWLESKIQQRNIEKKPLGEIHLGGTVFVLGIRKGF